MDYIIRKLKQEEVKVLDTFLYEAIFIPEGVEAPSREIINQPELQVYVENFASYNKKLYSISRLIRKQQNSIKRN